MSFILHIWEGPVPSSLDEAVAMVDEVSSRPEDTPREKFAALGRALSERFPYDPHADHPVWEENPSSGCDSPLWNLWIGSRHIHIVVPVVAALATRLGLIVLDPQNALYFSPKPPQGGPIVLSYTANDFAEGQRKARSAVLQAQSAFATPALLAKARRMLLISIGAGMAAPVMYFLDLRLPFVVAALVNTVSGLYGARSMCELVGTGSAARAVLLGSFLLPPACVGSIAWLLVAGGRLKKAIDNAVKP